MRWQRDGGSGGCCHLPRALCAQGPVNSQTRANTRIPLLGQESLEPEVVGGKAEGVQQKVLLPLPCSCIIPSQLLLATTGNWTLGRVELSSPLVWSVLSIEMLRRYLRYKCFTKKHHWYNEGGIPRPAAQDLQYFFA